MDEPFVLVVNPRAGAGAAQRVLPALQRALEREGARFEVRLTEAPRDATRIVREVLKAGEHAGIAVVGGDGTLSEAVNGFFEEDGSAIAEDVWLSPLPCGTGGDFRKTIGRSKDIDTMARQLVGAEVRRVDVGWLSFVDDDGEPAQRAFINIASFGLGGIVDRKVNEGPKWMGGTAAFLLGTLRAMIGYRNQHVRVTVDDEAPYELAILNLAIANGRYFGGGMHIAPRATIDDGLFDIVGLKMSALESLTRTHEIYRGTHLSRDDVWHTRARRVYAEPVKEGEIVLLDIDGEAPGALPATFEVKAGALSLRA